MKKNIFICNIWNWLNYNWKQKIKLLEFEVQYDPGYRIIQFNSGNKAILYRNKINDIVEMSKDLSLTEVDNEVDNKVIEINK